VFAVSLILRPGKYEYKFIVDSDWKHDPDKPFVSDNHGGYNNVVKIISQDIDSSFSEFTEDELFDNSFTTQDSDTKKEDLKSTIVIKLP
jgi:5'-AMP-activated protein kinase regulatory beta subunit